MPSRARPFPQATLPLPSRSRTFVSRSRPGPVDRANGLYYMRTIYTRVSLSILAIKKNVSCTGVCAVVFYIMAVN